MHSHGTLLLDPDVRGKFADGQANWKLGDKATAGKWIEASMSTGGADAIVARIQKEFAE